MMVTQSLPTRMLKMPEIEIIEPKMDKDFYRTRAKEALAVYLRGGTQRDAYADIIAGICELAYQKGLRDGRQKA